MVDAFDQAANFGGKVRRKIATFTSDRAQGDGQFAVEFIGGRPNTFQNLFESVRLRGKVMRSQIVAQRFNDCRELFRSR